MVPPVLRTVCKDITPDYPQLDKFIEDMWKPCMLPARVGLAAPQVNRDIRVFVIDSKQIFGGMDEGDKTKYADVPGIKQVFINAHIKSLNE